VSAAPLVVAICNETLIPALSSRQNSGSAGQRDAGTCQGWRGHGGGTGCCDLEGESLADKRPIERVDDVVRGIQRHDDRATVGQAQFKVLQRGQRDRRGGAGGEGHLIGSHCGGNNLIEHAQE